MGNQPVIRTRWAMPALLLGRACISLQAQEISVLAGLMRPDNGEHSSYS